jgi:hypothetical protein
MIGSTGLMGAVVVVPVGRMVVAPVGVKAGIAGRFTVGFNGIAGGPVGVPGRGTATGFPLMIEDGIVIGM